MASSPDAGVRGSLIAFYFLVIVAAVGTGRSLMHILAADGGANSIAGLAVDVEGGTNIIAIFAQWGASQLILAIFYWLAILRYRFLTPFMLSVRRLGATFAYGSRSTQACGGRVFAARGDRKLYSAAFGPDCLISIFARTLQSSLITPWSRRANRYKGQKHAARLNLQTPVRLN